MISQQYHSMNNVIITTATSIPAITPATTAKFTESLLLVVTLFCCAGVVGRVVVSGWVGGTVESVGLVEGTVGALVGFLDDGVNSLFVVAPCTPVKVLCNGISSIQKFILVS